jgi:hypothetical protein
MLTPCTPELPAVYACTYLERALAQLHLDEPATRSRQGLCSGERHAVRHTVGDSSQQDRNAAVAVAYSLWADVVSTGRASASWRCASTTSCHGLSAWDQPSDAIREIVSSLAPARTDLNGSLQLAPVYTRTHVEHRSTLQRRVRIARRTCSAAAAALAMRLPRRCRRRPRAQSGSALLRREPSDRRRATCACRPDESCFRGARGCLSRPQCAGEPAPHCRGDRYSTPRASLRPLCEAHRSAVAVS